MEIIKRFFIPKEVQVIKVNITEEEYDLCHQMSFNRWSNKKTGEWGAGILNNPDDPRKTERIGLLGEMAVGKAFNLPVNFDYMEGGDKFDFKLKDLTVDVKISERNHNKAYIKRIDASGYKIALKHDIYIFGFMEENSVILVGFALKKDIEVRPLVPALRRDLKHFNQEIPYAELRSIVKLKNIFSNGFD